MSATVLLLLAAAAIIALLLLVIRAKVSAFVAMLLVSVVLALAAGVPVGDVAQTVTDGMGATLGTVALVVGLGAMLGRVIETAGGAQTLAERFTQVLGARRVAVAVTAAAFVLGVPIFFDVGFIILAPIVFGFAYVTGTKPLRIGLPVAATLMALHVVTPPHPGPMAAAGSLGADVGLLLMVSLPVCAVVVVVAYQASRLLGLERVTVGEVPLELAREVARGSQASGSRDAAPGGTAGSGGTAGAEGDGASRLGSASEGGGVGGGAGADGPGDASGGVGDGGPGGADRESGASGSGGAGDGGPGEAGDGGPGESGDGGPGESGGAGWAAPAASGAEEPAPSAGSASGLTWRPATGTALRPATGPATVALLILQPILQIMVGAVGQMMTEEGTTAHSVLGFVGSSPVALLTAVLLAYLVVGHQQRWSLERRGKVLDSALPDVATIVFVTGAGGVFAAVLKASGIGGALASALTSLHLPVVLSAFLISLAIRASQGSATVAIITAGGLLGEAVSYGGYSALQVVLIQMAVGFGALCLSHVNDSGFWIVTKYMGMSVADGLRTWTVLSTVAGVAGFLLTAALWVVA